MSAALCKIHGTLVLAEVVLADGDGGRCPDCGAVTLRKAPHGWMECEGNCGFAILESHWLDVVGAVRPQELQP